MAQIRAGENPFRPGAGALPPVLAGRQGELALAAEGLESLARRRPPSEGLLLFGPRGNGKTVLLDRIAARARDQGMRAAKLPAAAFRSLEALAAELQELAGLAKTRVRGAEAAGFGSIAPRSPTRNLGRLLAAWIGTKAGPLVILVDEAHTIPAEVGRDFFDAVQEATTRGLPFWLLAAGTPDAPRRIREAGTFTERMFEEIPVGRLERAETLRALSQPTCDSGMPLSEPAAVLLAAESRDYPYFIQLLGSAAWKTAHHAGAGEISEQSARQGVASARLRIGRFYARRLNEARGRKIAGALLPLAVHLRDHGGQLGELEVAPFLAGIAREQSLPGDEVWLLDTLSDLGVLWQSGTAGWEMGIPSFADYLLALPGADQLASG